MKKFDPTSGITQVWSDGGGKQSTAMAALMIKGVLPKPDYAVIADTGRERASTWDYHYKYIAPGLKEIGVIVEVAPHSLSTVDIYSGADGDTIVMPMKTSQEKDGILPQYCSSEWKTAVVRRWLRYQGIKKADVWIGFSADEGTRVRKEETTWTDVYPLMELGVRKSDCFNLAEEMGWPPPPNSCCFMCPWQGDSQWRDLRDNWPKDFTKAVKLERNLRKNDPHVYFHSSMKTLDEAPLDNQSDFFLDVPCSTGECLT